MFDRFASWCKSLLARPGSPGASDTPCARCRRPATLLDYRLATAGPGSERYLCERCAGETIWFPDPALENVLAAPVESTAEVPVEVDWIVFPWGGQQILVLKEIEGPRRLSIATGYYEASAIMWALKRGTNPRPTPYAAWADTIRSLRAEVQSACVVDRRETIYFAEVRLLQDQSLLCIDVRPSDALLLSLEAKFPFRFTERLLATCATSAPEPS